MFGIFKRLRQLERRVDILEAFKRDLRNEKNCASGIHQWAMRDEDTKKPYMRCDHCYARPEVKP